MWCTEEGTTLTMDSRNGNLRSRTGVFLLSAEGFISFFSTKRDARTSMARGDLVFESLTELSRLTADCSSGRLVRVWNNIPGVVPIKKFASRQAAIERIWKEIQGLAPCHPQQTGPLPTESFTTTILPERRTAATRHGTVAARCDLPGWTISNYAEAWEFAGHVRLSPAPKAGGWAA